MTRVRVTRYDGFFGGKITSTLLVDDEGFGIINYEAREVFTRGQCHALALAIHQLTGFST